MAAKKSDAFFIRASTTGVNGTYAQAEIDLGAFVDVLGQNVLRIHSVQDAWENGSGFPIDYGAVPAAGQVSARWQLTTQTQTAMVSVTDKSLIASGTLAVAEGASGDGTNLIEQTLDVGPQHWQKGYLVGVETIYLACDSSTSNFGAADLACVVLECTSEKLSKESAIALSLSQQ